MENKLKKTLIALFATASVFAGVSAASAAVTQGTSTSNLTVRATLTNGCGISFNNGASIIDFGKIMDLSEGDNPYPAQHFKIKCTNQLLNPDGTKDTNIYKPASVALNAGDVAGSTISNRLMGNISDSKNTDTVAFQVYKGSQANSGSVWGDQTSGASNTVYTTPAANPAGTEYPFTVVLLKQDLAGKTAGQYSATLVATVNYTIDDGKGGGGNGGGN